MDGLNTAPKGKCPVMHGANTRADGMAIALGRLSPGRIPVLGSWRWVPSGTGQRSLLTRLLGWFWLAVLVGLAMLALTLQLLGPPPDAASPGREEARQAGRALAARTPRAAPLRSAAAPRPLQPPAPSCGERRRSRG